MNTPRYEASYGPNTKQWWLYDTETDEYCDPPIEVLEKVASVGDTDTADGLDEQARKLEEIANAPNDWIGDSNYRCPADNIDI